MRESGDTIYGLVKKFSSKQYSFEIIPDYAIERVDFKTSNNAKQKSYNQDSIIGFGYADIYYRYFYESGGWAKRTSKGYINTYIGEELSSQNNSTNFYPIAGGVLVESKKVKTMFYGFKKKGQPSILLSTFDIRKKMFSNKWVLRREIKEQFMKYFEDNAEILAEFNEEPFSYIMLERLIIKYNEWAKNK